MIQSPTTPQLIVAKRMKKLCQTDNNAREAATFIQDAVTLMDLVLNDESIKLNDITTVALRLKKERNSRSIPCSFLNLIELDTLLNLILEEKTND